MHADSPNLPSGPARPVKLAQLDVLRGICALMVALNHASFRAPIRDSAVVHNAPLFVDFFFVLSGFIMFYNYASLASGSELGRFMGLRFFRLYPLHLAMLLVFLAYECVQWVLGQYVHLTFNTPPFSENNAQAFLLNVLLLNGVGLSAGLQTFNGPSWSICAEFWTYLLFGLLVLGSSRSRLRLGASFAAASALALGVLLLHWSVPSLTGHPDNGFVRCVFSFFLGALLAMAAPARQVRPATPSAVGGAVQLGAALLALVVVANAPLANRMLEFVAPFTFVLLILCFTHWPRTWLISMVVRRPLLWLGERSYSIYMVHMVVLLVIEAFLRLVLHAPFVGGEIQLSRGFATAVLVTYVLLLLGVSELSYRLIERPGRQLGRELLRPRLAQPTLHSPAGNAPTS
jgi:peptidoglycan/LPS O-acetylase OafA/YrhL